MQPNATPLTVGLGAEVLYVNNHGVNLVILSGQCDGWGLAGHSVIDPSLARRLCRSRTYDIA